MRNFGTRWPEEKLRQAHTNKVRQWPVIKKERQEQEAIKASDPKVQKQLAQDIAFASKYHAYQARQDSLPKPEPIEKPTPEFIINHPPMGAPRMMRSDKWKTREVVTRYHALKDAIRAACKEAGYTLGGVLTIRFELPMPKSWTKIKRETMRGEPHQQKYDIDNCVKGFMDAFNEDDSHVHTIHASKVWADTGRIIITR